MSGSRVTSALRDREAARAMLRVRHPVRNTASKRRELVPPVDGALVHWGSFDHEAWSVQRLFSRVAKTEASTREVMMFGLRRQRVCLWHPVYMMTGAKAGAVVEGCEIVTCYHHDYFDHFRHPQVVAGIAYNRQTERTLTSHAQKPVHFVAMGGAESALPHYTRGGVPGMVTVGMVGAAHSPMPDGKGRRKGVDLLPAIARQLDPGKVRWLLIGPRWQETEERLHRMGFEVVRHVADDDAAHYGAFGAMDAYLSLSRLEGGPLPLLEAMGCGIYPIATCCGVAPEVVPEAGGVLLPNPLDGEEETVAAAVEAIGTLTRKRCAAARKLVAAAVEGRTLEAFARGVLEVVQ